MTSCESVQKQEMEEEEQRVIQEEASRMQSTRDTPSAAERQQQAKVGAQASHALLLSCVDWGPSACDG